MARSLSEHRSLGARRVVLGATILTVGLLQAFDSGAFSASPPIWILVGLGILIPAASALLQDPRRAIFLAIPVSALLLVSAKLLAEEPLPAILLISVVAGALILGNAYLEARDERPGEGA